MASNSARRLLADLSRDELSLVLKFVSVEDVARAKTLDCLVVFLTVVVLQFARG